MFLAGDQPQLPESEEASCRTACTSTSVPVQQMADGNPPKRKRSRDISEIHLEVLEAEKDKLRLESDYIKLKMKKVSAELELIEMQKNSLRNGSLNYLSLLLHFQKFNAVLTQYFEKNLSS